MSHWPCLRSPPGDAHNAMETAVSQHLLSLSDDQLVIVDRALTDLETQLLPATAFDENPPLGLGLQSIPSSSRLPGTRAWMAALHPVRTRLQRLQRLIEYARDAEIVLVNDALNRSLKSHALSNAAGKRFEPASTDEPPIEVG